MRPLLFPDGISPEALPGTFPMIYMGKCLFKASGKHIFVCMRPVSDNIIPKTMKHILLSLVLVLCFAADGFAGGIFIEAESFADRGGWVIDNQSAGQMGSPYLMAHGLGVAVNDAETTFTVVEKGRYRVWLRTRNWVKKWDDTHTPGRFSMAVDGMELPCTFGTGEWEWHWQDGGWIRLGRGAHTISLRDAEGFNARCDAIYLTTDKNDVPPSDAAGLAAFRREKLGLPDQPQLAGDYDLVVVGGGIAGICSAVSAARLGCKVALIQNRPVLGGNNSSEVRVGLSGLIAQQPYPRLGYLLDEIGGVGYWTHKEALDQPEADRSKQILRILNRYPEKNVHNAGPASNYEDWKKEAVVLAEPNIDLFLNTEVFEVCTSGGKIVSVTGKNITTGMEYEFRGSMFADCTGDGAVGCLAGADYRVGRESRAETGESLAPEDADSMVMGTSVQWYASEAGRKTTFPACPWAVEFSAGMAHEGLHGEWDWEAGMMYDQVEDIEYIRDFALRSVFGNWDYLKNMSPNRDEYADKQLSWVAYIGGKRESRRLMGDIVIREQDLVQAIPYEDASYATTWGIDLHYPLEMPESGEEPFKSVAKTKKIAPYAVPYRTLYSRNVENLFMAGRNVSVTHVALGSVRVMRTGGMMGEVVGMAASLCKKHGTTPRGVYENFLPQLQALMSEGVGRPGFQVKDKPVENEITIE